MDQLYLGYSKYYIALMIFSLEHVIIFFSMLVEALIPDVPRQVLEEERRRKQTKKQAQSAIQTYKANRNLDSLDDTIKKLKDISDKISVKEQLDKKQQQKLESQDKSADLDPNNSARRRRQELKRTKYDLQELQKVAINR